MNQYSNVDIQTATGLKLNFINKVNSRFSTILSPFRITGANGKIFYDDNGMRIWDIIKQEKEKGADIRQIRDALKEVLIPNQQTSDDPNKPTTEPQQTPDQTIPQIQFFVDALKDAYTTALKDREHRILLLEEGKAEREEREARLRQEVGNLKETVTIESQRRSQRRKLYTELSNLNGWSQRKEREMGITNIAA